MMLTLLAVAALAGTETDTLRFQQGVDYRVEARLDEETSVLHARARLRYTNRAPVALDTLWFHQHLNAFRPNSAWATRELRYGVRRFQNLGPTEHAFERLTRVSVGGHAVRPVYPGAPDSTVVGIPLPAPLRPGATAVVDLDWDARLSTLPRRQGRRGRHYDFAQWYPRIAVFERAQASGAAGARGSFAWRTQPLLPQGEFYGEFGSYDVTLEVRADQVFGSTGVPVEGDPGWQRAGAVGAGDPLLQRDAYPRRAAEEIGLLRGSPEPGRKRVRWRAEKVHHFGWSVDPAFVHEQGTTPRKGGGAAPIALHVLYLPGDSDWDEGVVLRRTRDALAWLQELFGPYPWPQLTNLHRLEPGGTEFPMLVMNGSSSEGLIVHEVTHQYLHGILANNEFHAGWLDEGFTSFVESWYLEERGATDLWTTDMDTIRARSRVGALQPVATPGPEFADPGMYGQMTYTKASLVFRMLRGLVGDETMRAILREYYRRHALQRVSEADFRRVAEEVARRDLDWFFDQWLHTNQALDYGIGSVSVARAADGRWRTRVEVTRRGEAWMPVTLRVGSQTRTLTSRELTQTVEVLTAERPTEVVLDPEDLLIDTEPANNRKEF